MVDGSNEAIVRHHPLHGRRAGGAGVSLTPAPAAHRLSLRAGPQSVTALSKALGFDLPTRPKTSAATPDASRTALWLGPDEWLIIDEGDTHPNTLLDEVSGLFSAVDVSHRNTAIMVTGGAAADTLSAGCPQDLSLKAFPVGACSRTVLGKIEVVVWRVAADIIRVECWRSYSDYAFSFLQEAARDVA